MAHKRSRNGGADRNNDSGSTEPGSNGFGFGFGTEKNPNGDNGNSHSLLSLFGGDTIHAITEGNPAFARGGFGELSIALRSHPQSPSPRSSSSSGGDNNIDASSSASASASASLYSYVAVKTIHNAMASPGGGRFGGFGGSRHEPQPRQLSNEVTNELLALGLLQPHPNIVPLVAVFSGRQPNQNGNNPGSLSLAFSYAPIDLREVLEVRRLAFRPPPALRVLRTVLRDVLSAIAHCHATGILHRDVKPGNLLVSSGGRIQLCDFGLARPFADSTGDRKEIPTNGAATAASIAQPKTSSHPEKALCTLYYRPPEVLLGGPSEHPSVDIWSAGVVLAELITGRPLWPGRNTIDQLSLVYDSLGTPDESEWPSVKTLPDHGKLDFGTKAPKRWEKLVPRAGESTGLADLLSKLVAMTPGRRLSARDALDHEWLAAGKPSSSSEAAAAASYREVRNELLLPAELDVPPLLFPGNRELVGSLGLRLAQSRRSIRAPSKNNGGHWQGPTVSLPKVLDS